MARISWEEYALRLAATAASRSEDPYHQVGCALLRHDRSVASLGYNGAPSGVEIDWSDRDGRRGKVIHAEANALRFVRPGEIELMATTMMPCEVCILLASAYGIQRVIYTQELDPRVYDIDAVRGIASICGIALERWRPEETE